MRLWRNPVECKSWEGLGFQNRFRRRNIGPLLHLHRAHTIVLSSLPNISIAFCNHKSPSQILSQLSVTKVLLRRLRLVEVKWLSQDHIPRDGTWPALESGFPILSLFYTFLFADMVLVLGSNHNARIADKHR